MTTLSRWIKTLWQDPVAAEPHAAQETQPPRIRQRLSRYTSS